MKYFKLVWLIMSGRLRLESRNQPEKLCELGELAEVVDAGEAFPGMN